MIYIYIHVHVKCHVHAHNRYIYMYIYIYIYIYTYRAPGSRPPCRMPSEALEANSNDELVHHGLGHASCPDI